MLKDWVLREAPQVSDDFAQQIRVSPLLARLLWQRQIRSFDQAYEYLHPDLDRLLPPDEFLDMSKAVTRIRKAIAEKERILVYGDYDVDGIAGSAIVFLLLKALGGNVEVFIPDRVKVGYGLKRSALAKCLGPSTRLLITVDNGITGIHEIEYLNSKKVDVIVVDHHEPKGEVPAAYALITSRRRKRSDTEGVLAACGLAFKLAWSLEGSLEGVKRYLDLAAVGTIGDMAPLIGENRVLVRAGLEQLSLSYHKGLRSLLALLRLPSRNISSWDVAFLVAPRINAAGRVGTPRDAFHLLTTDSDIEAANLARLLDEGNRQRQRVEEEAFREALVKVEEEHHFGRDRVIVVADEKWHEGVVGILAARLVDRFHRPSFAIALRNGLGKGSGRTISNFLLFENLMRCPDVFESFGGHRSACGLVIREDRIPDFKATINDIANLSLKPADLAPSLEIDAEVKLSMLDEALMEEMDRLEPYGIGNPRPVFLARDLCVKSGARPLGKFGCSFWVQEPESGYTAEALCFRRQVRLEPGHAVSLVFSPVLRRAGGVPFLQLHIEDLRLPDPSRR